LSSSSRARLLPLLGPPDDAGGVHVHGEAEGAAKDKWDFLKFGPAVPAANQPLESIAPSKAQSACKMT